MTRYRHEHYTGGGFNKLISRYQEFLNVSEFLLKSAWYSADPEPAPVV